MVHWGLISTKNNILGGSSKFLRLQPGHEDRGYAGPCVKNRQKLNFAKYRHITYRWKRNLKLIKKNTMRRGELVPRGSQATFFAPFKPIFYSKSPRWCKITVIIKFLLRVSLNVKCPSTCDSFALDCRHCIVYKNRARKDC